MSGTYVPISTTFNAYTETMPVKYNEDNKAPAVVKNDDVTEEEFKTYLEKIKSVNSERKGICSIWKERSKTD